ncbi:MULTISPECIES: ATP-binding cassette domain-containing protein [Actinobacillus]|nr:MULTISPECIES: ATP-binding cassette domain-containing protein [Actinobacillus]
MVKASFEKPNRTLLSDISLSFGQRNVYSLIGHNGSGKFTLIKLLAKKYTFIRKYYL